MGISADELQVLLQITNRPAVATEFLTHLDSVIDAAQLLLPFERCLVMHERPDRPTLAMLYRSGTALERKTGSTAGSEQPLQISRYLESFSRFGTFQNAFFWFARPPRVPVDGHVAAVLREAKLTEGIAGSITSGVQPGNRSTTLVQLQYAQHDFEAKHLVFANLITNCLHTYFEQSQDAACTTRPLIVASSRPNRCRSPNFRRRAAAWRLPSIVPGLRPKGCRRDP